MPRFKILIVDDEEGMLEVCSDALQRLSDTEILTEVDSRRAMERIEKEGPDLMITDIFMPGVNGLDLLRLARQHNPHLAALVMTARPTVEIAVECMKLGAADYITKPLLPEDLVATVQRLLESKQLQEENLLLRRQMRRDFAFGEILGQSAVMHKVFEAIQRAAETHFDVLIIGETGTGKELVARAIHQRSPRKDAPFVPVDCGAIPEDLMESEFFGHERGAFTGAQQRTMGLLELANKGTFFLDEIAQFPMRLQAKLLRVLQERRIRRVGGTTEISIDVRIITASSVDIRELVRVERFRPDLYHRIHVLHIDLPPLRERLEDIPLLTDHFLRRYAKEMQREPFELSPEVMEVLTSYSWPGNVRELENTLKQAVAMAKHPMIAVDDLSEDIVAQAGSGSSKQASGFFDQREHLVAAFEKNYLQTLLGNSLGDVSAAAREAQLPRVTFYRLLKKHELDPDSFRAGNSPAA